MDEIEEQLERLAEHRAAQVPPFSMPTGNDLVERGRLARRAPVLAAIAACLAALLVVGGLFLVSGGNNPSSVQAPGGRLDANADAGCAGRAYVDNNVDGTVVLITLATGAV